MDEEVGQSILDSIGEGLGLCLAEAMEEPRAMNTSSVMESYGPPKVNKNETISVPVIVATVVEREDNSANGYEKIDQAFLDRNVNLLLQKLVLRMNPGDERPYSFRQGLIFFDQDNFKLEYVEGGVVKLTTTLICDLRPVLNQVRDMRWSLEDTIWGVARKTAK